MSLVDFVASGRENIFFCILSGLLILTVVIEVNVGIPYFKSITYIQGVPGGMDKTLVECSLC